MNIEILHIAECPNWEEAGRRVHGALAATGRPTTSIEYRLLQSSEEAAEFPFAGSPTILIDGVDAFPGSRTSDLACRIYRTPTGFAGMPTVDQLVEVLNERS
ncbi:thioredoxin family protein [Cryobacterium tepidiphilum]|uniref:Thioredoxin family protein n=1 Tax=Cryobacterium tepidiphilum TaxID=2486026 RepID=A0A3M8L1G4_9MICO|nr:thioredoxin family protein [Cryobacterium tepidiphilum]RNE59353.1 thioredoxin family protein [Cryobacterium tepidiphilum]